MRLAFISDIHGNLEALSAVLDDIYSVGVDRIICLGDVVGYGANPIECADAVFHEAAVTVHGNHELMVTKGRIDDYVSMLAATAARWTRDTMKPEGRKRGLKQKSLAARKHEIWTWLRKLKRTHRHNEMLFTHATPNSAEDYIMSREDARVIFESQMGGAQLMFCGHTHVPGIFHHGRDGKIKWMPGEEGNAYRVGKSPMIVNVGSVGQPRDHDPRACWAWISSDRRIRYRRLEYDLDSAVQKLFDEKALPNALAERLLLGE
jgi:predicted phosphodiesterase